VATRAQISLLIENTNQRSTNDGDIAKVVRALSVVTLFKVLPFQ
jgi:hypothetical protein